MYQVYIFTRGLFVHVRSVACYLSNKPNGYPALPEPWMRAKCCSCCLLSVEQVELLPCPTLPEARLPANAGIHAEPVGVYI